MYEVWIPVSVPTTTEEEVQLWHVVYEDDHEEDLNEEEMEKTKELYLAEVTVGIADGSSDSDAYDPLARMIKYLFRTIEFLLT